MLRIKSQQHSITVHNHFIRQMNKSTISQVSSCSTFITGCHMIHSYVKASHNKAKKKKLQQKVKSCTNILWLSVKEAFLCFNYFNLQKKKKQEKWTFTMIHWLKYKQKSDGFNLQYYFCKFSQNNITNQF